MALVLRIRHETGMQRISVDDPQAPLSSIQREIAERIGVPVDMQILSRTPLHSPNFFDENALSKPIKSFNFQNGEILYLVSLNEADQSKGGDSNFDFKRSPKCLHDSKGRCFNCIRLTYDEIQSSKGKCLHGENSSCNNCVKAENNKHPHPLDCDHKENAFCNNCLPKRKIKKSEEIKLLKDQRCLCAHPNQRCVYCDDAKRLGEMNVDKHIMSFTEYIAVGSEKCSHDKTSFNAKNGTCAICGPKPIPSYKIQKCDRHPPWPKGVCSKCAPPTAAIALQTYRHTDQISLMDRNAMQAFISTWLRNPARHQACFLVGKNMFFRLNERCFLRRVVVDGIYIPPQEAKEDGVVMKQDNNLAAVQKILNCCKLKIVGWAFTTAEKEAKKYGGKILMTAHQVLESARLQKKFSDKLGHSSFVSMVISRNSKGTIEPTCYQISDQCVSMRSEDILSTTDDPGFMCLNPNFAGYIPTVIYKSRDLQKGEKFLPDEFLVKVATMQPNNPTPFFRSCSFPMVGATEADFKRHIEATMGLAYQEKFSDLSLLLWSFKLLGLDSACRLAEHVAAKKEVDLKLGQKLDIVLSKYFV